MVPGDTSRGCQVIGPWPQGRCLGQMVTNSGHGSSKLQSGNESYWELTSYPARPARFVTYMVRITNSGKPTLSTNASNTKSRLYLFIYLFIYLPVSPSLHASLNACPTLHPSTSHPSKSVREQSNKAPATDGKFWSFLPSGEGCFGKQQLISVRISVLFMLWPSIASALHTDIT